MDAEESTPTEKFQEALARFMNLFAGRLDVYGCENRCVKESLTLAVYETHLKGGIRIGIYPLVDGSFTHWIAIDIDNGSFEEVRRFTTRCAHYDLNAYIERSKSKGYHVWVFFDQPYLAVKARAVVFMILQECEIACEVFPKQDVIGPNTPYGNFLNLPLCGRDIPQRTIFVTLDDQPLITTVEHIGQLKATPTSVLDRVIELNGLNCGSSASTNGADTAPGVEHVAKGCLMIDWARTHQAQVPEPWWYAMISNLARLPGGVKASHRFSREYPGYTPQATDEKILHAINDSGPHTCAWIEQQGFDCSSCPWRGKIKSPVEIARKTTTSPTFGTDNTEPPDTTHNGSSSSIDVPTNQWPDLPDEAAYHGLAGEIVRAIESHSEADPVALLVQLLIAFGSAIGHGPHFTAEADHHAFNLFAVLVGATSKGRKGSAWGQVRRLLEDADKSWANERVQSGLSSGEGLVWGVRDPITKRVSVEAKGERVGEREEIVDEGITDKRLLLLEPEFASTLRVMGRDGNTLSAIIRQAWDTGHLRVLTKNSPAKATGAHISIIGHITKDELLRYLDSTEAGNGFGNRFLWICVRRSKCLPEGGHVPESTIGPLMERLMQAAAFARQVGELKRDEDARQLWAAVYPKFSEGNPGLFGAITSRAEAQVMRLTSLYALLDLSSVITMMHLNAGMALWAYCEASARYIFGQSLGDPIADQILRALRAQPEGLTRTNIRDLFGRHVKAAEIDRALGILLEQGLARTATKQTNGRPEERWFATRPTATNAT